MRPGYFRFSKTASNVVQLDYWWNYFVQRHVPCFIVKHFSKRFHHECFTLWRQGEDAHQDNFRTRDDDEIFIDPEIVREWPDSKAKAAGKLYDHARMKVEGEGEKN